MDLETAEVSGNDTRNTIIGVKTASAENMYEMKKATASKQ